MTEDRLLLGRVTSASGGHDLGTPSLVPILLTTAARSATTPRTHVALMLGRGWPGLPQVMGRSVSWLAAAGARDGLARPQDWDGLSSRRLVHELRFPPANSGQAHISAQILLWSPPSWLSRNNGVVSAKKSR
jgi:hypothetical protein